ncbi:hypothetical protein QAD02_012894 [Eretmocerus hayati]|uniref:Uncharacterized protein n=1 Tax=Eretmocerus hayati TaxID=131215 RepID=A0ACC2P154_9HYME|nr:hypothetical protein QAD02_012894 [Eretmocerus hayati]
MDQWDKRAAELGRMTVVELKELLFRKGAKRTGKKADLVQRIVDYEKYLNFGRDPEPDNHKGQRIITPPMNEYKDLHGLRYFIKGRCRASRKKHVEYESDACFSMQGEIEGSSCECAVGWSEKAHCKHVIVLLLSLLNMCKDKKMILNQTCTEKLQTFHQPSKKYNDSPQQAKDFQRKRKASPKRSTHISKRRRKLEYLNDAARIDDTKSQEKKSEISGMSDDYKTWYIQHFRNTIANGCSTMLASGFNTTMPMKMIIPPANMYGVVKDHSYRIGSIGTDLLRNLKLLDVSHEQIIDIENETRGQANNPSWKWHRSSRLPASKFHRICNVTDEGAAKLVNSLLNPKLIYSKPTSQGIMYESKAVDEYNSLYYDGLMDLKECGLFVMKEYPHICGTPDRLAWLLNVLEVKCPYTAKDSLIHENIVPYLGRDEDGDNDFIDEMLVKLNRFYEKHSKPAILKKYIYKNTEKFI